MRPFFTHIAHGIVAVTSVEGPEKNTVQYAPDGLNFEVVGKVTVPPVAAGPHVPDAFADSGDGRGVTWGLSHIQHANEGRLANGYLVRFDCNLSRDVQRAGFYRAWNYRFPESALFQSGLRAQRQNESRGATVGGGHRRRYGYISRASLDGRCPYLPPAGRSTTTLNISGMLPGRCGAAP